MTRMLLVLAALTACKTHEAPAEKGTGSQAVVAVTQDAARDAALPDAPAARPTKEQALEAGRKWIAAVGRKDPKAVVAASAIPFKLTDEFDQPACGTGVLADAAAIEKAAKCMQNDKLRATVNNRERAQFEAELEVPDPYASIEAYADQWRGLVPAAERPSHTLVTLSSSHPEYPADVLYALLSVRLADGAPIVDGAMLVFTSEGG